VFNQCDNQYFPSARIHDDKFVKSHTCQCNVFFFYSEVKTKHGSGKKYIILEKRCCIYSQESYFHFTFITFLKLQFVIHLIVIVTVSCAEIFSDDQPYQC
jgi:hypothetical protein